MALTTLQRDICHLVARNRVATGESYVAGASALNELLGGPRVSHDLDIFHDTREALIATWEADRVLLERAGLEVRPLIERDYYVQAQVNRGGEEALLEWVQDSAFRFFPLIEHPDFGLTLHPFDLATNKVLALVGRREVRDWVDVIRCDASLQPLAYLAWAAAGKDPGFTPAGVLEYAARARYTQAEVEELTFQGEPPLASDLSRQWHAAIERAREVVRLLPPERVGCAVLAADGALLSAGPDELPALVAAGGLTYHFGKIRGAYPQLVGQAPLASE